MSAALLRLLLKLAPRDFRRRWADELMAVHAERARALRGAVGRMWFAAREVAGVLRLVLRLRLGGSADWTSPTTRRDRTGILESGVRSLRHGLRSARRHPRYALAAVAVLALGIGATTAIFSAVNAFFFRPLPFRDADRLVALYETNPEFGWTDADAAPANALDWRERVEAFQDVAVYSSLSDEATWVRDGEPVLLTAAYVSGNFFDVLGVPAALGRTTTWEESWEGRSDVVVLSHHLWRTAFGGDPGVVGRRLTFGDATAEVVGVMPEGFVFPGDGVDLWVTWGWRAADREAVWFRRAHFVRPVARLAPGVTLAEADAQLQTVVRRLQEEHPATNRVMGAGVVPLRDFLVRDVRQSLLLLQGAVLVLLLLACVNVGNLALVRTADRAREVALRRALGARPGAVAVEILGESVALAALGGALGLALGWLGVRALETLTPLGIDGATDLALDHRVVLATLAASIGCGLLFGLAPVLRAGSLDVQDALKEGDRGARSRGTRRSVQALVTAEVALALVLVVGAGLMVRTSLSLRRVDPGFRTEGVLAVQLTLPQARYQDQGAVVDFWDDLLRRLEARPGIERAGTVGQLPLDGTVWSSQLKAEEWPPDRVGYEIVHRRADAGYFQALEIPLLRGRMFDEGDRPGSPWVVLVNETFAREHFPGEDPLGRKIAYDQVPTETSTWYEIVGIVGDQHQVSPGQPPRAEVFEHRAQDWASTAWVVARTAGDPMAALSTVRAVLEEMDPLIPIEAARPLRQVWRDSMARETLILTLLGVFGVAALLLAAVGVYGVTAEAVGKRRREMGIRMALGADRRAVVGLVLRQGMMGVAAGLVVGLGAALVAARSIAAFLYQVRPTDPATLSAVAGLLALVGLIACWLPARRATRLDPTESLRAE